jgi:hypothetical protein
LSSLSPHHSDSQSQLTVLLELLTGSLESRSGQASSLANLSTAASGEVTNLTHGKRHEGGARTGLGHSTVRQGNGADGTLLVTASRRDAAVVSLHNLGVNAASLGRKVLLGSLREFDTLKGGNEGADLCGGSGRDGSASSHDILLVLVVGWLVLCTLCCFYVIVKCCFEVVSGCGLDWSAVDSTSMAQEPRKPRISASKPAMSRPPITWRMTPPP